MSCAINMWLKHSKIVDKNKERGLYQIYLMAFKTRVSYSSLCRIKNKASLVVQMVKNLLAMQETQVQSLVWEHPLEKGMATHSSTLVLRIPWTEEPGRLQYMGLQRVRSDWTTNTIMWKTHRRLHNSSATLSLSSVTMKHEG